MYTVAQMQMVMVGLMEVMDSQLTLFGGLIPMEMDMRIHLIHSHLIRHSGMTLTVMDLVTINLALTQTSSRTMAHNGMI